MGTTDVIAALDRMGAPGELLEWRRWIPTREQAWQRCDRADWLLWLAAADVEPIDAIVVAAAEVVAHMRSGRELPSVIDMAIAAAMALADVEACRDAADACEQKIARADESSRSALEAGAWVARAADGATAARAADEAKRTERGRHLATMVGIAPHAITPMPDGPLRLAPDEATAEPGWQLCAYAVAAAAEAVGHAAQAMAQDQPLQQVHADLSDLVRKRRVAAL